jgi:hypothetical protein
MLKCNTHNHSIQLYAEIKTDLNKSNRYQNELSQTIVLDLGRDAKFSKVMYKYYKALASNATRKEEMATAKQVLNELRQRFAFFIRIVDGERVEIKDDEDIVLDVILANIQSREECKMMWLGNGANQPERKRHHPTSEYSKTSSVPADQATSPPQFDDQSGRVPQPRPPSEIISVLDDRLPNRLQSPAALRSKQSRNSSKYCI